MTDETKRLFSRDYKLAALRRMLAGENVSALARELGVRRNGAARRAACPQASPPCAFVLPMVDCLPPSCLQHRLRGDRLHVGDVALARTSASRQWGRCISSNLI
jgi:hypothetical protein